MICAYNFSEDLFTSDDFHDCDSDTDNFFDCEECITPSGRSTDQTAAVPPDSACLHSADFADTAQGGPPELESSDDDDDTDIHDEDEFLSSEDEDGRATAPTSASFPGFFRHHAATGKCNDNDDYVGQHGNFTEDSEGLYLNSFLHDFCLDYSHTMTATVADHGPTIGILSWKFSPPHQQWQMQ